MRIHKIIPDGGLTSYCFPQGNISVRSPAPTQYWEIKYIYVSPNILSTTKVNSSPPNGAFMRQWTGSALVQVMTCRLFGAKPLPQPILPYCQLDPCEQISMKFKSNYKIFHSRICTWKCHCEKAAILSKGRWVNPQDYITRQSPSRLPQRNLYSICKSYPWKYRPWANTP